MELLGVCLIVGGTLCICWLAITGFDAPSGKSSLPDHNLAVRIVTPTSTKWRRIDACPSCHEEIGHEEVMTDICLSCGAHFEDMADEGAARKIVWLGEWRDNYLINNENYVRIDGRMVLAPAAPIATLGAAIGEMFR